MALLAVAGNAIALQIAQVGVHRLGADELPSAPAAALRVELHDPRLHRHAARSGALTGQAATPPVPALQIRRDLRTTTARVESAARLSLPGQSVRITARPADRLMHFADKSYRALTHPYGTRWSPVADPAGADADVTVFLRHRLTIGPRNRRFKASKSSVALWRSKTCPGAETANRTSQRHYAFSFRIRDIAKSAAPPHLTK